MKKLLSMPPNVVDKFHAISGLDRNEYFCTSDPIGHKLGSGGGTTWLLEECAAHDMQASGDTSMDFDTWLAQDKRILVHAGGQSRRLPAYAACGKIMLPVPVFRWARGQKIDQTLLDLQLPLYEDIMHEAPDSMHTLIVSGDVFIRTTRPLQPIPEADVVCYGLWVEPSLAKNHGVYFMDRKSPDALDFILQKPSTARLAELMQTHLSLMDIGIWLLSDKAMNILRKKSKKDNGLDKSISRPDADGFCTYDLYSEFGCALGAHPTSPDEDISSLKVVILPLTGGEFYHFGTTPEMISSTLALQNVIKDQRLIIHKEVKKQPSIFVQNSLINIVLEEHNNNIWIENSCIGSHWRLSYNNVITGVPVNDWNIDLTPGTCIDVEAYGETSHVVRPYGFRDAFRGNVNDDSITFIGMPITSWLTNHNILPSDLDIETDIQAAHIFPICDDMAEMGCLLQWMICPNPAEDFSALWKSKQRLSADEISAYANLERQETQRKEYRNINIPTIASNYKKSIFYQVNLKDMARQYADNGLVAPAPLPEDAPLFQRIQDSMFRSETERIKGNNDEQFGRRAFALLQEGLTMEARNNPQHPTLSTYRDQIVWGRSAVRIDIAGGWTDTPPYCLIEGGNVVNMAIELNGQQPLQVYVKPSKEYKIICRSIDLGAMEMITTYDELSQYNKVGSPFSIPKAALALCGFHPEYSAEKYSSLEQQLQAFGSGIEITLLSAIPAGSGLGTSSILASTLLGALSDFCGLCWDKSEIGNRTLILEQLLTTGGGWQDQYGGILNGIKLLQTKPGFNQVPVVRWLPDTLFQQEYQPCHLLYYTGITRTAKHILTEIVRGMFLNSTEHLQLLSKMKQHSLDLYEAIQLSDFETYGRLIRKTWSQNRRLDSGTEPIAIRQLCSKIDDLCLGYKLPGAGGGGYLYMVAKDPEAAVRIKDILQSAPLTPSSRFVDMKISDKGLQISRS